jgi:succinate dehydrogenase subunit D
VAKSNEPFWWAFFGAGGMVAAFLMPVMIILTSMAVAADWLTEERLWTLLSNPLVRVYVFVVISLPLFHWAHRFRYILEDLGGKPLRSIIAVACYGSAMVGTLLAAVLVLRLWP